MQNKNELKVNFKKCTKFFNKPKSKLQISSINFTSKNKPPIEISMHYRV